MKEHPLEIIAKKWQEDENSYLDSQSISEDFYEIDLVSPIKTSEQIKEWHSAGSIEINKKMESHDFSKPFNFTMPPEPEINKFHKLLNGYNVPKKLPALGYFELYKSANLTDFINGSFLSQYGLILNESTKGIFELFNCGKNKFFNLKIEHKGIINNEYFFYKTNSNGEDFIDYKKSTFFIEKGLIDIEKREDYEFNSRKEIEKYQKQNQGEDIYVKGKKIVLNKKFPNYDYFIFNKYGIHKKLISKRLRDKLINLTGIEITTTNQIFK